MKRGGLALAALLVITGIFRFAGGGSASAPSESQATESKPKTQKPRKPTKQDDVEQTLKQHRFDVTLRETIADFFGDQTESEDAYDDCAKAITPENELTCHWNVPHDARPDVQFVIALLPDPKHTNLGLFVDLGTEAIQNAAQDEGFDFDRAVMPWSESEPPQNGALLDALVREEFESENEKFPGLLIFRQGATRLAHADPATPFKHGDRKTLFVLVVGEHPTAGINKAQFNNAIAMMRAIRGGVAPALTPPLFVLGPTFSGSLYSLNDLLRSTASQNDYRGAFVYSGTIRGTESSCWFLRNRPSDVQYESLQETENDVLTRFDTFVRDSLFLRGRDDIAVLSEDETSYGRSVAPPNPPAGTALPSADSRSTWATCRPDDTLQNDSASNGEATAKRVSATDKHPGPSEWSQFQFPRGIAQFRSAYQRQFGDSTNSQEAVLQGHSVLHLDMDTSGGDDLSPTYARGQLPLVQEAVMLGIVANLHQRRPKFVVLRATDPLDQLFLAKYLRDHYPEGRIVVVAPDLLFSRESDGSLTGLVTIGTYPLISQEDWFLYHELNHRQIRGALQRTFENSTTVGTFNAMLALLEQIPDFHAAPFCLEETPCSLTPDRKSLPSAPYADYGSPFFATFKQGRRSSLRPGFWASVLGRDGYWTLKAEQPDEKSSLDQIQGVPISQRVRLGDDSNPFGAPRSFMIACILFVTMFGIHIYLLFSGSILSRLEAQAIYAVVESPDIPFGPQIRISDRWRRSAILAMITLTLTGSLLLLCCAWKSAQPFNSYLLLFYFPFLFPLVGCSVSLFLIWQRHHERLIVVWSVVIAVALFIAALFPRFWFPGTEFLLVSRRILYLNSSVSPILPLIFFACGGLFILWFELRGMALVDVRRPRLPIGDLSGALFQVDDKRGEELRNLMRPLSVPRQMAYWLIPLIPIVVITMNLQWVRPIQSLEGIWFDSLYSVLLWAGILFFFAAIFRMLVTWAHARVILSGLDRLPLRDSFSRLKEFSWGFVWSIGGSTLRDSYKFLNRELESVDHLYRALQAKRSVLARPDYLRMLLSIRAVRRRYADLMRSYKSVVEDGIVGNIPMLMNDCGLLQIKMAELATDVVNRILEPVWKKDRSAIGSDVPASLRRKPDNLELVAGEYVSFVYANFFVTVLLRMRSMVMGAIATYIFILLSISSYPFEPAPMIFALAVLLICVLGGAVGYVYAQMHREATLSRLTDTKEGELGPEFWMQFVAAGALPVLTLLASQFPAISRVLYSLVQPALQSVK